MNTGDTVKVRVGADELYARVLESEKYRGAYVLRILYPISNAEAWCTVFPDLPELPPASWFTQELYALTAWMEYPPDKPGAKLFPMPMKGGSRMIDHVDKRVMMMRRIDLILEWWDKFYRGGSVDSMEIVPGTDWEREQLRKLIGSSGEI